MLKSGDPAPDLSGIPRTDPSRPLVLFFFPKAFTPVCTAQACAFRDAGASLLEVADVVGVSSDPPETQARFASENRLTYPLVSDEGGRLARAFRTGWLGGLIPLPGRCTFVVREGIVVGAFRSELGSEAHAKFARETLGIAVV